MERCPYCLEPLPENGECSCGYFEKSQGKFDEALHPGTVVGACYLIGGVLGQGGFGITYKGYDLNLEKIVAIKEFFPSGMVARASYISSFVPKSSASQVIPISSKSSNVYEKSLKSFHKEAQLLAQLNSMTNVVHVYRIFQENNTAYYVMDFVKGKSLSQIYQQKGKFTEEELIPLLNPILDVLEKIHNKGILHRDIAPDNILIDDNGDPVLLDFGAAKAENDLNIGGTSSLVVEKKGFTAIEQISGMATNRSDIYSLGATYYFLLSGVRPPESYVRAQKDTLEPLTNYGVSQKTSDAVMKALAFNQEDRWESVSAFREALNKTALSFFHSGTFPWS